MSQSPAGDMLAALDVERRALGQPAGHGGVVREYTHDGSECRIVYAQLSADDADHVIATELALARAGGYRLEWKLYGHDAPEDLGRRLCAAGFRAGDPEQVLMLTIDEPTLARYPAGEHDIRLVNDQAGLADYAEIAREIGRGDVEAERKQLAEVLQHRPDAMSVHVAYVDGEPAACGRVHFRPGSDVAELAGGRTKTRFRRQGLFTAVVGARLRQALDRGCTVAVTDALPTSEPILGNRGFRGITSTQPYLYDPPR